MRIKSLSPAVANQIAAGEVIENPASVVKELLENALDADASSITIDVGFGGLNQIKISDNGSGILSEDLPLAIAPHATSKLTELADLATLTSMGFRGEALASIASISRLTIRSKPAEQDHAMMLQVDGSTVQLSPCARNQGTTIDVRDLFYNAPVRRRFLRSERSEYMAIEQVVKRFAMSAPHIGIVLKHNEKLMLELPAAANKTTLQVRIKKLLGKLFMDSAIAIDVERAGMHLRGWISGYGYQRSQNDKQWFYLNHRMVKDKLIQHAFKQAYENKLYPGRYPTCLLYLSIPTDSVDVNVHPTKHEVRFAQPRLVHDFIGSQIAEALMHTVPPETQHATAEPFINGQEEVIHRQQMLTSSPLILRENYIPCPQFATAPSDQQHALDWIVLNEHFGLITVHQHPYLFDITLALNAQLMHILTHEPKPMANRPLLVPISIEHQHIHDPQIFRVISSCQQFGINIELSNTHATLRTLPISLPQLNVTEMLQCLMDNLPDAPQIPALLVNCQSSDPNRLSAFEKDMLKSFIIHQLQEGAMAPSWCLRLDAQRCREIMHV